MIVHEFNTIGTVMGPNETKAKLVVHSDRMLASPIPLQRLEAIAGWEPQVFQSVSGVEHRQFALNDPLKIGREALSRASAFLKCCTAPILEPHDHPSDPATASLVSCYDTNGKSYG